MRERHLGRSCFAALLALGACGGCGGECEYDGDCGGFGVECVAGFCLTSGEPADLTVGCTASGDLCYRSEAGCGYAWDSQEGCLRPKLDGERCGRDSECGEGLLCRVEPRRLRCECVRSYAITPYGFPQACAGSGLESPEP